MCDGALLAGKKEKKGKGEEEAQSEISNVRLVPPSLSQSPPLPSAPLCDSSRYWQHPLSAAAEAIAAHSKMAPKDTLLIQIR